MNRVWKLAGVSGVLVLGLTGCTGGGDDEGKTSAGGGGGGGKVEQASVGDIGTVDPTKTIAKTTVGTAGVKGAKLDIGIVSLKVSGKLANLTVVLTPHLPTGGKESLYHLNGNSSVYVSLIDTVNLKRHLVVKDSSNAELQPDYVTTQLASDQPAVQTYVFAAPPENVKAMDVLFAEWAPFRNVPVAR